MRPYMPLRMMCMCAHSQLVYSQPAQKKGKIAILDLLFICVAGIALPGQKKRRKKMPLGI